MTKRYLPVTLSRFLGEEKPLNLHLVYDGDVKVYENAEALARAFVVPRAEVILDPEAMLNRIGQDDFDPSKVAFFEETPEGIELQKFFGETSSAQIMTYSPTKIKIGVESIGGGYLVLSDTYFPSWKAFVNGVEKKVYRVNHALRGIFVPAGKHTVEFVYAPKMFYWGATISIVTCLGGVILLIFRGRLEIKKKCFKVCEADVLKIKDPHVS